MRLTVGTCSGFLAAGMIVYWIHTTTLIELWYKDTLKVARQWKT